MLFGFAARHRTRILWFLILVFIVVGVATALSYPGF